jgi:hypothetical protein
MKMNIPLNFYPVLTQELIDKVGFQASDYHFKYTESENEFELDAVQAGEHANLSTNILIRDDRCVWTADTHNLCFSRVLTLNNPKFLFGEKGVAVSNAELGLALQWTSKTSNQRGIKVISSFRKDTESPYTTEFESYFPPGHLKGTIDFQIILYIRKPGKSAKKEEHLANSSGVILGVLDEYTVIIDGSGSVFPIVEVYEPSQPLWWVNFNWGDPMTDSFDDENIRICVNKAHRSYELLNTEAGLKESPFLVEVIASSLQLIISKLKESEFWEGIVKGEGFEHGSIAQAVNYFITTFQWDTSSPERLALSIRKYFDSRI